MHPVLERYLDFSTAWSTVRRRAEAVTPEARAFLAAVDADAELWKAVAEAEGKAHPPEEAQEALLGLAAHAALRALDEDEGLAPALQRARGALRSEGATESQADGLLAALVLEEAFGDPDAPEGFDAGWMADALGEIPQIAGLTPARVDSLTTTFVHGGSAEQRDARQRASDAVVELAWGEGPEPVTPEHVTAARDALDAPAREALRPFLRSLRAAGIVGGRRLERLESVLGPAARA